MAVKRNNDETIIDSGPDFIIKEWDALIVLNRGAQVEKFQSSAGQDISLGIDF